MKKQFLFLLICVSIFVSCNNKKTSDKVVNNDTTSTTPTVAQSINDTASIKNVVVEFYNWYGKEYSQLMKFNLYRSIRTTGQPPYKIDWAEVDRLEQYIRSNVPQLGEEFLRNQRMLMTEADSAFKADAESELPYGFDYDWYTNSQEDPQYTVDAINKQQGWKIDINGDKAIVDIKGTFNETDPPSTFLKLNMKKESNKWVIAKIGGAE